jgi:UDP-2,3-diacylglucosamine pyrophosphatase LpxH
MSTIKIIVSDLHLADGSPILDCFSHAQQTAFEGLLHLASTGSFASTPTDLPTSVELIINGDCFDFLVTPPYTPEGVVDQLTALQKIEKIIAAHAPFFAALRSFIALPGRSVTFTTGNHDLDLCFALVRARICTAIIGEESDPRVHFCPTRFYRPLPDLYIEHGNHYDFWNHATQGLWDEQGQPLTLNPERITLSVGSRYFQHAAYLISLHYPYFDHFEPSMNSTRQIALLSLLNPSLIIETAQHTMQLLSYPRQALTNLLPGEAQIPARLFEEAMIDFVAFQEDMAAHKRDWTALSGNTLVSPSEVQEFMQLRAALSLPLPEAVTAICTPDVYQMGESVAEGIHAVLQQDPSVRYAIAGHTHMLRHDTLNDGSQVYLNTASWTRRFAQPTPAEMTPELLAWLRAPAWNAIPLRDVTQLVFALVTASEHGPTHARLCVWEAPAQKGQGSYRVLVE